MGEEKREERRGGEEDGRSVNMNNCNKTYLDIAADFSINLFI